MNRHLWLLAFLLCTAQLVQAQKIYESLAGIQLENNAHNWQSNRGLDTTLNRFHYYMPIYSNGYAFQGNIGLAAKPFAFSTPTNTGFSLGPEYHQYYRTSKDSIDYYRVGGEPYTNLFYMAGGQNEQFLNVVHAQEMGKGLNFGLDYRLHNAEGQYERQDNKQNNFSAYVRYLSPKQRYGVIVNYFGNKFTNEENGGLASDSTFLADLDTLVLSPSPEFYDVNLLLASNRYRHRSQYLEHFWQFGLPDSVQNEKDSLYHYEFDARSKIYHFIEHTNHGYSFQYTGSATDSLATLYFDSHFDLAQSFPEQYVQDSIQHRHLETGLGWMTTEPNDSSASWWIRHQLVARAEWKIARDSIVQEWDTAAITTNQWLVHLQKGFKTLPLLVNLRAQQSASNEYGNGSFLSAGFVYAPSVHRYSLRISSANRAPDWIYRQYMGSRFYWQNDWSNSTVMRLKAGYSHEKWRTKFMVTHQRLSNYLYFASDAQPAQSNQLVSVSQIQLNQPIYKGPLYMNLNLLYQQSSNDSVIAVPSLYARGTIALETKLFEDELHGQIGFDVTWHNTYYADAYDATTRQFYRQFNQEVGGYAYVDAYLSVAVKRARMFVKWFHANAGLMGGEFYSVPGYPAHFRGLKFGLDWTFNR